MLDGVHVLHDLVAHGNHTFSFIDKFHMYVDDLLAEFADLPAEFATGIVAADQIQLLVAGLDRETKSVQTACKDALVALAQHGCSFDI